MTEVRLESYTKSVNNPDKNLTELIAYYARVSNPDNQGNDATSSNLVHYLIRHGHWSPLEMVHAEVKIKSTRDIIRQVLRHVSMRFQEFSLRYAKPTDLKDNFFLREARLQDYKNRQNSLETTDENLKNQWNKLQQEVIDKSLNVYNWAIENGIAKEVARAVLPEGNTGSTIYMTGSMRSFVHYVMVRSGPETQKEHREVALGCAKALEPVFPMIMDFVKKET